MSPTGVHGAHVGKGFTESSAAVPAATCSEAAPVLNLLFAVVGRLPYPTENSSPLPSSNCVGVSLVAEEPCGDLGTGMCTRCGEPCTPTSPASVCPLPPDTPSPPPPSTPTPSAPLPTASNTCLTTSAYADVISSQFLLNILTPPPSSTCTWARCPSYFHSANTRPRPSIRAASAYPAALFASIGFTGSPGVIKSWPVRLATPFSSRCDTTS